MTIPKITTRTWYEIEADDYDVVRNVTVRKRTSVIYDTLEEAKVSRDHYWRDRYKNVSIFKVTTYEEEVT